MAGIDGKLLEIIEGKILQKNKGGWKYIPQPLVLL
jgi:hypothetical protein